MSSALVTFVLALARLSAIAYVQVLWRNAVPAWGLVAVALSAMLATLVRPVEVLPTTLGAVVLGGGLEVLLGLVIGLLVTLPGYALLGATSASARTLRTAGGPLAALGVCLALAVALGAGLHRPLVAALLETFAILPLGEPQAWLRILGAQGLRWVVQGAHAMLVLLLALATPVLLAAAVADVVTRIVARGPGPVALALEPLALWLRTAASILALGASWAAYGHVWARAIGSAPP